MCHRCFVERCTQYNLLAKNATDATTTSTTIACARAATRAEDMCARRPNSLPCATAANTCCRWCCCSSCLPLALLLASLIADVAAAACFLASRRCCCCCLPVQLLLLACLLASQCCLFAWPRIQAHDSHHERRETAGLDHADECPERRDGPEVSHLLWGHWFTESSTSKRRC